MIHIGQSQEITCVSLLLSSPSGAIQTAVSTSNIYLQQCVAIFMEYSQSGKITQALVSRIFFFFFFFLVGHVGMTGCLATWLSLVTQSPVLPKVKLIPLT